MLMTSLLLALAMAANAPAATKTEPVVSACQITLADKQPVPAADAGVLTILRVEPGTHVKKGEEIGRIDDTEATAVLNIKQLEYEAAKLTAESNIDIRHADMAAQVNEQAYLKLVDSNRRFKGTVTAIDILKARLEWKRGLLAIEQAKQKNAEAGLNANAKQAEVGAAKVALARRILRAPFDGIVVKVVKNQDEWVAPGEPVVDIVGVNRLIVKGDLDASDWNPEDIQDRKVTVEVTLPGDKKMTVSGKIIYVSPVVIYKALPVMAEIKIDTLKQGALPRVRAGLDVSMTIHVNQPVVKTARTAPAPARAAPVRPTSTRPRPRK